MNIFSKRTNYKRIDSSSSSSDESNKKEQKSEKISEKKSNLENIPKRERSKSTSQPARGSQNSRTRSAKPAPLRREVRKNPQRDDTQVELDISSSLQTAKSTVAPRRKETTLQRLAKTQAQQKFNFEFDRAAGIYAHHFGIHISPSALRDAHSQLEKERIAFNQIEYKAEKQLLFAAATAFIEQHGMPPETRMYVQQEIDDYLDEYHGRTENQQPQKMRNLMYLPGEIKSKALEKWENDRIKSDVPIQHFDPDLIVERSTPRNAGRKSHLSMLPKKTKADRKQQQQMLAIRCKTEAQVFNNIGIAFSNEELDFAQSSAKHLQPEAQTVQLRASLRTIAAAKFIGRHAPELMHRQDFHSAITDALISYEKDLYSDPEQRRFRKLADAPTLILQEAKENLGLQSSSRS